MASKKRIRRLVMNPVRFIDPRDIEGRGYTVTPTLASEGDERLSASQRKYIARGEPPYGKFPYLVDMADVTQGELEFTPIDAFSDQEWEQVIDENLRILNDIPQGHRNKYDLIHNLIKGPEYINVVESIIETASSLSDFFCSLANKNIDQTLATPWVFNYVSKENIISPLFDRSLPDHEALDVFCSSMDRRQFGGELQITEPNNSMMGFVENARAKIIDLGADEVLADKELREIISGYSKPGSRELIFSTSVFTPNDNGFIKNRAKISCIEVRSSRGMVASLHDQPSIKNSGLAGSALERLLQMEEVLRVGSHRIADLDPTSRSNFFDLCVTTRGKLFIDEITANCGVSEVDIFIGSFIDTDDGYGGYRVNHFEHLIFQDFIDKHHEQIGKDRFFGLEDPSTRVVAEYPENMKMVSLAPWELPKEGQDQGMCIGDPNKKYIKNLSIGRLKVFSLRKSHPVITIAVDMDQSKRRERVSEMKGKGNRLLGFSLSDGNNFQEFLDNGDVDLDASPLVYASKVKMAETEAVLRFIRDKTKSYTYSHDADLAISAINLLSAANDKDPANRSYIDKIRWATKLAHDLWGEETPNRTVIRPGDKDKKYRMSKNPSDLDTEDDHDHETCIHGQCTGFCRTYRPWNP